MVDKICPETRKTLDHIELSWLSHLFSVTCDCGSALRSAEEGRGLCLWAPSKVKGSHFLPRWPGKLNALQTHKQMILL